MKENKPTPTLQLFNRFNSVSSRTIHPETMATILFNEGHPGPKYARDTPTKKQLLNNILDGMARTRPNALWATIPVSTTTYSEGYRRVTYSALANAVNGIAWWLTDELGSGIGKNFPTICYMGWNDIRYATMVLGAVKAGYKVRDIICFFVQ